MEQKNNYIIVGIFITISFVLIVFGFLWMQKHSQDEEFNFYKINTKDSVSGLSEKAAVKFNGLTVGEVSSLYINEKNLEEVTIIIKIDAQTPIKEDTTATVESLGITGLSYIQLFGGSVDSPVLETSDSELSYGIIKSSPSIMTRVDKSLTAILDRTENTLNRIAQIANDENLKNIDDILKNVSNITLSLSNTMEFVDSRLEKIDSAIDGFVSLETSLNTTLNSANSILSAVDEKMQSGDFNIGETVDKNLAPLQDVFRDLDIVIQQFRQNLESIKNSPSDLFFKSSEVEAGPGE